LLTELRRRVTVPLERATRAPLAVDLAVAPRTHDEEVVAHLPLCLQGFPAHDRAIHILLIPQSLLPQRRNVRRVCGDQLVERLLLPIFVIGDVLQYLLPEGQLVITNLLRPIVRRAL